MNLICRVFCTCSPVCARAALELFIDSSLLVTNYRPNSDQTASPRDNQRHFDVSGSGHGSVRICVFASGGSALGNLWASRQALSSS